MGLAGFSGRPDLPGSKLGICMMFTLVGAAVLLILAAHTQQSCGTWCADCAGHQESYVCSCMQLSILRMHLHLPVDSLQQSSSNNCCSAVVQVIVISFTLIISLMLGTFAFVLKVGAIRIND